MMSEATSSVTQSTNNNVTIIQVDKDISFVLDTRDVNYGVPLSYREKTSALSKKTYSKKHPVTYNPCVSFSDDSIDVIGNSSVKGRKPSGRLSLKVANSTQSPIKAKPVKKRLSENESGSNECPVHKKSRKRGPVSKVTSTKMNGHITTKSRSQRELQNGRDDSSDSDIEIIEIVTSTTTSRTSSEVCKKSVNGDVSRRKKQVSSILKHPSLSNEDVPITEADTAPFIPSCSVTPGFSGNESSSSFHSTMKWLTSSGTLTFSPIPNGESVSANETSVKFNDKLKDKFHLYLPELKTSKNIDEPKKKPKGKRELDGLYKNLNEISWAQEKSFKQLLSTNLDNRHSERINAKVIGDKKLRHSDSQNKPSITATKQKGGLTKRNAAKLSLNRVKYGSLKNKFMTKTIQKQKVPFSKVNKTALKSKKISGVKLISKERSVGRPPSLKTKNEKINKKTFPKSNIVSEKKSIDKTEKENSTKSVVKNDVTMPVLQPSVTKPVIEFKDAPKPVMKTAKSILKNPKSMLKVRFKDAETQNGPKVKSAPVDKQKPPIAVASTSKSCDSFSDSFQNSAGNCSYSADSSNGMFSAFGTNMLKADRFSGFKNSSFDLQKFDISNEFQMFNHACSDRVLEAAMKKGSKLRVTVEPIEHTKLWNAEFFEAFKKHVLEQAFMQTFERRDNESINSMFQELQDTCYAQTNIKSLKKKKTSDEEVLRSSIRNIEKGHGYKEIYVKKFEKYHQFMILPSSSKRNSLNIEAIKELREAFIQAKKDPSCRAVLLNSSGSYFCTGLELTLLLGNNKKQVAEEMASSIRDLILTLSTFTKPCIAAVNGTTVGLGVALLTYCDIVLASDKATFCIPATRLGYLPEGGVTLTLPQVVGSNVAAEMLLYGRRLTATQALNYGLISEVIWPQQLMNEVVPRMEIICSQPLQVMETTKTMVRCHLWDKLKTHMEREWRLLPPLWLDAQCQHNMKRLLSTGWLIE